MNPSPNAQLDDKMATAFKDAWIKTNPDFPQPADDNLVYRIAQQYFRIGYAAGGVDAAQRFMKIVRSKENANEPII